LSRAVDFLCERVIYGHVVKFDIECNKLFKCVERKIKVGPRKHMLEEIPLWIKMLFVERGLMKMGPDRME